MVCEIWTDPDSPPTAPIARPGLSPSAGGPAAPEAALEATECLPAGRVGRDEGRRAPSTGRRVARPKRALVWAGARESVGPGEAHRGLRGRH